MDKLATFWASNTDVLFKPDLPIMERDVQKFLGILDKSTSVKSTGVHEKLARWAKFRQHQALDQKMAQVAAQNCQLTEKKNKNFPSLDNLLVTSFYVVGLFYIPDDSDFWSGV